MRAVAEAHVASGVAVWVEVVGVREAPFVPVGRSEKGDDLLALRDSLASDFDVLRRDARDVLAVSYTHLTLPTKA